MHPPASLRHAFASSVGCERCPRWSLAPSPVSFSLSLTRMHIHSFFSVSVSHTRSLALFCFPLFFPSSPTSSFILAPWSHQRASQASHSTYPHSIHLLEPHAFSFYLMESSYPMTRGGHQYLRALIYAPSPTVRPGNILGTLLWFGSPSFDLFQRDRVCLWACVHVPLKSLGLLPWNFFYVTT